MKIEDVKIGMEVIYAETVFIVEDIIINTEIQKEFISIVRNNFYQLVLAEDITPYSTRQAKRVPLSEMSDEEFDELLKLGYETEYKKCVPDIKQIFNGMYVISDDNWETCKLTLDGRR